MIIGIMTRRVYDPPHKIEGRLFLVDGLWPRGIAKERLGDAVWLKAVAPSAELRRWYGHDPARWEEFVRRYHAELDRNPEAWAPIVEAARVGPVTLLFATREASRGNAEALRRYLTNKV